VTSHRDLLLGLAVVAVMSLAYLGTGAFTLTAPGAASATTIIPVVTCVARDPANAGSYIASFGYERTGGPPVVTVPYATSGVRLNYVDVGGNPLPPRYGVPADFALGAQRAQFSVRALETQRVTWWLASDETRSAVATSDTTPVCAGGPGDSL